MECGVFGFYWQHSLKRCPVLEWGESIVIVGGVIPGVMRTDSVGLSSCRIFGVEGGRVGCVVGDVYGDIVREIVCNCDIVIVAIIVDIDVNVGVSRHVTECPSVI